MFASRDRLFARGWGGTGIYKCPCFAIADERAHGVVVDNAGESLTELGLNRIERGGGPELSSSESFGNLPKRQCFVSRPPGGGSCSRCGAVGIPADGLTLGLFLPTAFGVDDDAAAFDDGGII